MELQKLSDSDLYQRCKNYGLNARIWKRRFAGLLPEVLRRGLHRKRGCVSIHEFAYKLGGMSKEAVDKVLRLSAHLADKPLLREQLESGSEGWSKIEAVAFVARPETDAFWARKVVELPKLALEAFVNEKRKYENNRLDFTPGGNFASEKTAALTFRVRPAVEERLRLYKHRMEKAKKRPLALEEVLELLLDGVESDKKVVQEVVCPSCAEKKGLEATGRAIPRMVQKVVQSRFGEKCGFRGCRLPATSLHHTRRFSLDPHHDPGAIVPLCTAHERLVHSGLVEDERISPVEWRILDQADRGQSKWRVDQMVQRHRKEAILPS
jgi:hypothetical protein